MANALRAAIAFDLGREYYKYMPILHGKVDEGVLVFPPEENANLYKQCEGKLQPDQRIKLNAGRSTITIAVNGEPDLTNEFRGLLEIMLYVRNDSLLALENGTRFDRSKLSDGPAQTKPTTPMDVSATAHAKEATPTGETRPINQATSETSVPPGKHQSPPKAIPGRLPPQKPLGDDAASAAGAAWDKFRRRK